MFLLTVCKISPCRRQHMTGGLMQVAACGRWDG